MKTLLGYASFVVLLFAASQGFAQDREPQPISPDSECTVDADCIDGETCMIASTDVACPPCADGTECEPCDEPQSYGYCTPPPPPPCSSDADCASGDVCVTYSYEICSGSTGSGTVAPCASDEPCDTTEPDPEPEPDTGSCSTETESLCVPQFVAPCQIDSDCGAGFSCTDVEICECSGGAAPMDPDDGTEPMMDTCTCAPSGEKYCELNEVTCDTDADCSGSLVCTDFGGDRSTVACTETPDGEVACDEPVEPPAPEEYCAPVGYDDWGGATGGPSLDRVAEASGQSEDNLSGADRIDWGPDGSSGSKSDAGGCSAAGADASVFGLLLLAGMLLRRRRD